MQSSGFLEDRKMSQGNDLGALKWLIAATILGLALLAACHEQGCRCVLRCTLLGCGFGVLLQLNRLEDAHRRRVPTAARIEWAEIVKEVRAALVIGLFTGLAEALQVIFAG
jgi:hypothetical protein